MPNFYYTDANGQRRLINPQQLKALAVQGVITPDTPLEAETGQKGKAGQIKGLFTTAPVVQSTPTRKVKGLTFAAREQSAPTPDTTPSEPLPSSDKLLNNLTALFEGTDDTGVASYQEPNPLSLAELQRQSAGEWQREQALPAQADRNKKRAEKEEMRKFVWQREAGKVYDWQREKTVPTADTQQYKQVSDNNWGAGFLAGCLAWIVVLTGVIGAIINWNNTSTPVKAPVQVNVPPVRVPVQANAQPTDAFWQAVKTGTVQDVRRYIEQEGVNVNARDNDGRTPLCHAIGMANINVAKYLIEKGADVNAKQNKGGWTPLHFAALQMTVDDSMKEIVILLDEKGADFNAKNNDGKMPFDIILDMGVASNEIASRTVGRNPLAQSIMVALHTFAERSNPEVQARLGVFYAERKDYREAIK